jgi:3-hydroxyisobutyrate dehydrogenase-like beta-hydroxyacid dehydrogenase
VSVGFIGLGNLGAPMARQLLKLGEEVVVLDVAEARMAELTALGARAGDVRELAESCRIISLCVRDEPEVAGLLYGPAGLLGHMGADTIIVIHSTVTQAAILAWGQAARQRAVHLLDAPVTGGAAGAQAGTLTYMVGGAQREVERCRPLFMTSAAKLIHAGPLGSGILLKLCNNLMSYAAFTAIDEADRLARAGGLDPALVVEVGRSNGVVTAQMEAFLANRARLTAAGPQVLQELFAPFAALAHKDLAAALVSARALGIELPGTQSVTERIENVFLNQGN